jgi:hypothetical protein
MFRICPHCDFEWHENDGGCCPACHAGEADEGESARRSQMYDGGAFGSGSNFFRMRSLYRAIGLIALVFLLYLLIGGG